MAAFSILLRIEAGSAHADELLRGAEVDALSAQDRGLATTLVMGTLRWQIALDAALRPLLARPDAPLPAEVRIALRMGAFQLLHLDRIPPHAALSESVELAKMQHPHAAGMVNAVLRKLAAAGRAEAGGWRTPAELAEALAHPAWMVERWARRFGMDATASVCAYDQQPPPVTVRLLDDDAEAALTAEGIELAAGELLMRARRVVRGDVTQTEAWRRGSVRIQDEGSQLVAELAAAATDGKVESILDCCAAPGGKTAVLAERHRHAHVLACDASARRLGEMRRLLEGSLLAERIEYRVADASKLEAGPRFDLALCDAPCSGTGTLARNPEIRLRLKAESLPRQQKRQVEILAAALQTLRPGGRMLYSTCSLEREENEAVVQAALQFVPRYRLLPLDLVLERMAAEGVLVRGAAERLRASSMVDGFLRLLPGEFGCDGFFAALLGE